MDMAVVRIGERKWETMSVLEFCCKRIAENERQWLTQVVGFRDSVFVV